MLKWHFEKHKEVHANKAKYCHYFNNKKECLFAQFRCKFKHEVGPKYSFDNRCRRKLCQFQHLEYGVDEKSNTMGPRETHTTSKESCEVETHTDFKEIESEFNNIICSKYCSDEELSGPGYHACDENYFRENQGIDVKSISEIYDPNVNDFIKTYPCL